MPAPAARGPGSNQHADKPPSTVTAPPPAPGQTGGATAAANAAPFVAPPPAMTAERLQDLQDIADLGDPDADRRDFERMVGELTGEVRRLRDGIAQVVDDLDGAWWSEADDLADRLRALTHYQP